MGNLGMQGGCAEPDVFGVANLIDRVNQIVQEANGPIGVSAAFVKLIEKDRDAFSRSSAHPYHRGRQHRWTSARFVELEVSHVGDDVARIPHGHGRTILARFHFAEIHRIQELGFSASGPAQQ